MDTKYKRQLKSAQQKVLQKGTLCTWFKAGEAQGNDPTPEFPDLRDSQDYKNVPIVFIPSDKINQATVVYNSQGEVPVITLFGIMAGGLDFVPAESDAVLALGELRHVTYINITQPDGVPILYQIGMR